MATEQLKKTVYCKIIPAKHTNVSKRATYSIHVNILQINLAHSHRLYTLNSYLRWVVWLY